MSTIKRSIAVYKALIDTEVEKDILDPFQRVVEAAIFTDINHTFTTTELSQILERKWLITIPDMVLITILGRIIEKKAISKSTINRGAYLVLNNQFMEENARNIEINKKRIEGAFYALVEDFITYTKTVHGTEISNLEATKVIEAFVSDHATSLSLDRVSILDSTNVYFADYFLEKCVKDEKMVELLKTITFGFILAECLFFTEPNEEPRFSDMKVVIDTPLLFKILGINEIDETDNYLNMISLLQKANASVCTFNHCVEEMEKILDGSSFWIESGSFDYSKASDTSLYYLNKGSSKSDIEEDILSIRQRLKELNIDIINETYSENSHAFIQDISRIKASIYEVYQEDNPKNHQINTYSVDIDAKSINDTYILRQGTNPRNLANCNSIFVTNNYGLVFASQKYSESLGVKLHLPVCIFDISLGTYLWLDNPMMLKDLAIKQMISQAFSIMTPTSVLWNKFIQELTKSVDRGEITPEKAYALRTSPYVSRALVKTTLKDLNNITQLTPKQIIDLIRNEGKAEAEIEFQRQKEGIIEEKDATIGTLTSDLSKVKEVMAKVEANREQLIEKKITFWRVIIYILSGMVSALGYIIIGFVFYDFKTSILNLQSILYFIPYTVVLLTIFLVRIKNKHNIYGMAFEKVINCIERKVREKHSI